MAVPLENEFINCAKRWGTVGMARDKKGDSRFQTTPSLIDDLSQQDPQRWRTFILLYGPMMRDWMRKAGVKDETEKDDIEQEVLRSVVSSIHSFKFGSGQGSFRGWLRTILRRRVADWMRSKKLEKDEHGRWVGGLVFSDEAIEAQALKEEEDRLRDEGWAIDDLEEDKRLKIRALEMIRSEFEDRTYQMFWSATADGRSTAEIAEDFKVSPAAVRMAKSRVLTRLKQLLPDMQSDTQT